MTALHTVTEVADALQISVHAVYKVVAAGNVAPQRTSHLPAAEMRFTDEDVVLLMRATRRHLVLVSG